MCSYEKRVVAFIDILGFKKIIKDSQTNPQIVKNIRKIISINLKDKKWQDRLNEIAKNDTGLQESIFSDSIILSSKLDYGGFYLILSKVSCILQTMIECGFIARGAVTIGDMYHLSDVAFGPALVEAVILENELAIYPRVILTEKTYLEGIQYDDNINCAKNRKKYIDDRLKGYENEIGEKLYYVDFLSQKEDYDDNFYYYNMLKEAKKVIDENMASVTDKRIIDKYVWLQQYLKSVCKTKNMNYDKL